MGPLVLVSDFGATSPYPGQMALAAVAAGWRGEVVHLWHDWPAYRADLGPLLLPRLVGRLPAGAVVVAVVDPGVGSQRRVLAVEAQGVWWVAPDNGLLSAQLATASICVDLAPYRPGATTPQTFHGRDWMIPAAMELLSKRLNPSSLASVSDPHRIVSPPPGLAFWDAFGNGVTTVPWDSGVDGHWWGTEGRLPEVEHFSQHAPGGLVAVQGSMGLWEIAVVGGSARLHLGGTLDGLTWKAQ